jgi:hypothetical protein
MMKIPMFISHLSIEETANGVPPVQLGGVIVDIRKAGVRVIFSTGTDWVLPSQAEYFVPSMDTLSNESCWWYRKYAPGDTGLEGLETEAQEGRKRLVGRSAAGAAVGGAEAIQVSGVCPHHDAGIDRV